MNRGEATVHLQGNSPRGLAAGAFSLGPLPARGGLLTALLKDLLRGGQAVRFTAPGHSMARTILDGEAIVVEPLPGGELRSGRIVLYVSAGVPKVHRIVRWADADGARAVIRGDSPSAEDEVVRREDLLGVVVAVERRGRLVGLEGPRAKLLRLFHSVLARAGSIVRRRGMGSGGRPESGPG